MDLLKKIAQICRQHFEKILLTLALLGLAFAVWILYGASQKEEEKAKNTVVDIRRRPVKPVAKVDLTQYEEALKAAANPLDLNLSPPHPLVNPVKWQRKADGQLIKIQTGEEVGVSQIEITNITPLYFRISLDKINAPGSYFFGVQDESGTNAILRRKVSKYAHMTDSKKNEIFVLLDSKGPPENPEVTIELVPSQQRVTVSKDKPYQRIESYTADLKYKIDGTAFPNRRVWDALHVGGEDYKIVAINQDEVVLSALINNRNHTIKYSPPR